MSFHLQQRDAERYAEDIDAEGNIAWYGKIWYKPHDDRVPGINFITLKSAEEFIAALGRNDIIVKEFV